MRPEIGLEGFSSILNYIQGIVLDMLSNACLLFVFMHQNLQMQHFYNEIAINFLIRIIALILTAFKNIYICKIHKILAFHISHQELTIISYGL